MMRPRLHTSASPTSSTAPTKYQDQSDARLAALPSQRNAHRHPSQQELQNEAFNQTKFEALGLQFKKARSTITPVEQERLGVLQAKMDDFWAQRVRAPQFEHHRSQIPAYPPNQTRLPDDLKAGIEQISGYSLDAVQVHYNSPKPAQLQALAYTQGTEIHVASGQEEHLPHEAWHVVQQMQGRVKPTMQMKDRVLANDDRSLEHEADVMGAKAIARGVSQKQCDRTTQPTTQPTATIVQRYAIVGPNQIFAAEPPKRPWFGYPYAIAAGGQLVAQTIQPGVTGQEAFLNAAGSGTASTEHAANGFSLRVSNDCQMAIEDADLTHRQPKMFFATQKVITTSNQALLAIQSKFSLQPSGGATIKILPDRQSSVTLYQVTPRFQNASPDLAPQNCNEMAARIMNKQPQFFASNSTHSAVQIAKQLAPKAAAKYNKAHNDPSIPQTELDDILNDIAKEYVSHRKSPDVATSNANQYADPKVGQSYMIASIGSGTVLVNGKTRLRDYESKTDRDVNWAYHFGGVVARSGNDRITLENYARGDGRVDQADPRWYFQMYGTAKGQSFHEFHKAKNEYANPVTIGVT
jgi:hypothetical protein